MPDTSHIASANAMLSEFSRTGATTLAPVDDDDAAVMEDEEPSDSLPQPIVRRDLTDTASLLRELSSLGFEDEPPAAPSPSRPAPSAPRPVTASAPKKKRGLFGR
jgi:hypothetical protein